MRCTGWSMVVAACLASCGGGLPSPAGIGGDSAALERYDRWVAKVDGIRSSVEDAQRWVADSPKALATALGLPETATPDQIQAALQQKLAAAGIRGSGSLTVQIELAAGASGSAEAGAGGASAQGEAHATASVRIVPAANVRMTPEVQQIIDAAKACLEHIAAVKPRLEPIAAQLQAVISEGQQLATSIPNDFTGVLAAKAPEYTTKFQERIEFMTGLSGSLGGTIEASVQVQTSVTVGLGAT